MRFPKLLVYESDRRLARVLQPLAAERRWSLHEPRRPQTVLDLLRDGGPAIFVLRVGQQLDRELALLDEVGQQAPDTASVVVADVANEPIAHLAWDLGAAYVLLPPQSRELLRDIVARLMETAAPRAVPGSPTADQGPDAEDD